MIDPNIDVGTSWKSTIAASLVAVNSGTISNCYVQGGNVSGSLQVGGLVGANSMGEITASFWDIETSGLTTSAGGTGKTMAEMQTADTFLDAGWDFIDEAANGAEDIWWILEGQDYPRLLWQFGRAFAPHPQHGTVDVMLPVILSWASGGFALHYDIYFGEDEQAVANATTETQGIYRGEMPIEVTTYDPGKLVLGRTYYWRIDEVNQAYHNSPWKGNVWSFTTADFIVVDDFESYNEFCQEYCNRIWDAWLDGFDYPTNGSQVRYNKPPFTEHIIVHGGFWSMPYFYDNSDPANYSEATKTLTYPRDWTEDSVGVLSLWFHGDPNNKPDPMCVVLNDSAVACYNNPDALFIEDWMEWRIDL